MPPTIQLKRGTSAALLNVNPFPLVGEIIFEQDTGLFKIGDGIRAWNNLPYANPQSTLTVSIGNVIGLQEALNSKSDVAHTHSIANVAGLQAALDAKAAIANPTFTGTVGGITKGMVGLGNVDNTSDLNKPISTAVQTALAGKAASTHTHDASAITTGTLNAARLPASVVQTIDNIAEVAGIRSARGGIILYEDGIGIGDALSLVFDGIGFPDSTFQGTAWTGSVGTSGVTFGATDRLLGRSSSGAGAGQEITCTSFGRSLIDDVDAAAARATIGLGNVDNTSDANKPISTATQTALDGKAATTHSHGNIDPFGAVSAAFVISTGAVGGPLVFDTAGAIGRGAFGTQAGTICQGNDSRLSDSRTPTGAAGGNLTGNYPNPTIAAGAVATSAIADGAVTTAKLADGSITTAKFGSLTGVSAGTFSGGAGGVSTIGTIRQNNINGSVQFNVDTFGVVTVGTWQGTAIAVAYGGTGATTAAAARTNLGAAAASHTHAISDITNLQTALDSKLPTADINTDLLAGAGIGFSYNSTANALTVYSTNENYITALGAISGSVALNYDPTTRPIQTMTLGGTATTFTKGTGWPTSASISVDVVLKITVTTATTVTWSIVNEWYSQPAAGALGVGTHLFLLRAIGSTIEGHYIGSRTN